MWTSRACLKSHFSRRGAVAFSARPLFWRLDLCTFSLQRHSKCFKIRWLCCTVVLLYKVWRFWSVRASFAWRLSANCWSYIFIPLCSKLWYCEVKFSSLSLNYYTYNQLFGFNFSQSSSKLAVIDSLVCLLKSFWPLINPSFGLFSYKMGRKNMARENCTRA